MTKFTWKFIMWEETNIFTSKYLVCWKEYYRSYKRPDTILALLLLSNMKPRHVPSGIVVSEGAWQWEDIMELQVMLLLLWAWYGGDQSCWISFNCGIISSPDVTVPTCPFCASFAFWLVSDPSKPFKDLPDNGQHIQTYTHPLALEERHFPILKYLNK